jgi:glycine/D-amino acid oxidase-like deaminating enzyme
VRSFDLAVIGAGVHGATVALCAQASGLRTALVTRSDLAGGASGRVPLLLRRGASRSSMTGFVSGFGPHLLREIAIGDESLCLLDGPRYVVEAVVSALSRGLVLETGSPVIGVDLEDRVVVRTASSVLSANAAVFATGAAELDFLPEADRALAAGELSTTRSVRFDRAITGGAYELAIDETRVLVVPLGQSTRVWAEGRAKPG